MPTTQCAVRRLKNQQMMLQGEIQALENEQYAIWTRAEAKREKLTALLREIHERQRACIMAKQPPKKSRQQPVDFGERIDTMLDEEGLSLDGLKALLCEPEGLDEYRSTGKNDGIGF